MNPRSVRWKGAGNASKADRLQPHRRQDNRQFRVVAKIVARLPADLSELPAQTAGIRTDLRQEKTKDRTTLFEAGLKKRLEEQGKLKILQDAITRLVQSYSTRG